MRPTVADRVTWTVCLSVTVMSPPKTAEPIEMPFGLWTRVGRRKYVLHGAHWRHLANTIEPSLCGGDAVLCRLIFNHFLFFVIYCYQQSVFQTAASFLTVTFHTAV